MGVVDCGVQWGFRVAAQEEVVPQSITGFGAIATGGESELTKKIGGRVSVGTGLCKDHWQDGCQENAWGGSALECW